MSKYKFEAVIKERVDGRAISRIFKNGGLLEEKVHTNISNAVQYLRFTPVLKNYRSRFSKAELTTNDGRVVNLIH